MIFRLLTLSFLVVFAFDGAADPKAPKVNARAWLLIDHHSGTRLAEHQTDKALPTGHLNKLMVAYTAFKALDSEELSMEEMVQISPRASRSQGPKMFAPAGASLAVQTLLQAVIVARANDATLALAEHIASDEQAFVSRMNSQAISLGMSDTYYRNVSGKRSARQQTTVADTALLARALIDEFPAYYEWFAMKELDLNGIKLFSRNALLWRDETVDGVTAFGARRGGYSLVVSSQRGTMRLTVIVLGAPSERAGISAARQLLSHGFEQYETRQLYQGGKAAINLRIWMGSQEILPVGLTEDLYLTLKRGEFDRLQAKLKVNESPFAPVPEGQIMGELVLYLDDKVIGEHTLLALDTVDEGSVLRRMFDRIEMWLRDIPEDQPAGESQ
jgi:D-alanyl-D-alanine carboxypeptidase (penicillin-binding protein 5/6)